VAAAYQSKGKLHILSNFFTVEELLESKGKERGLLLQHYDNTKRAGDHFNELVSNFHNHHAHRRQEMTLLNGWIEWALTNGFILARLTHKPTPKHTNYLMYISNYLLK
jgi:hypothetical protein